MPSSNPTTLTFCHFAQPLVGKNRKIDKIAINQNFISQFLLPLVCKTHEFAKNAINQNFALATIPLRNLVRLSLTRIYKTSWVTNNWRMPIFRPLYCKTHEFAKNAKNWNFEAVAIPAGNLVRLSLTKKYIASRVMNNLRSKFFVMYIALPLGGKTNEFAKIAKNENFALATIPLRNLVRLSLTRIYKTSWVTNNWRMPIFRPLYCKSRKFAKNAKNQKFAPVAIPLWDLVRLSLTRIYKAISVMNNLRSKFFIMYIAKNAINQNFASATIPLLNQPFYINVIEQLLMASGIFSHKLLYLPNQSMVLLRFCKKIMEKTLNQRHNDKKN